MHATHQPPLRVFYAAGPGDIVNSLRAWAAGGEDPSQLAKTYSSEFYDRAQQEAWHARAVSSHPRADAFRHGRIEARHLPAWHQRRHGLAYHLEQVLYGLRLCWQALTFRAQVAVISDGAGWLPIFFLLSLVGCRVVLSLHCTNQSAAARPHAKPGLRQQVDRFFFRHGVSGVLAVSSRVAQECQSALGERYVPVKRFFPQYPGFVSALPPQVNRAGPILYVGRIEANKGVGELLEAYDALRPHQDLVYCGEGSLLPGLRQAVKTRGLSARVHLLGNLQAQELIRLYREAACVVVPTRSDFAEGFNKVIAEGLLFGKPVIATHVCPSALEFREQVRVIAPDSAAALRDAMEETLKNLHPEFNFADLSALADPTQGWGAQLGALVGKRKATMRLGYLVPEFPTQTHAFFWREVQGLTAEDVDVHLYSTRRPAKARCRHAFAAQARAETTYLFPPRPQAVLALLRSKPAAWAAAWEYLQSLKGIGRFGNAKRLGLLLTAAEWAAAVDAQPVDHVHVHSCADAAHLAAVLHRLRGVPYSLSLHGDPEIYGAHQREKMATAAQVFPVTQALQQRLVAAGLAPTEKVQVVRMGVDTTEFQPQPTKPADADFQFITVARLNRMKGHRFALHALAQLNAEGHPFHYHIAGEGAERTALELLVAELDLDAAVTFHGSCGEARVRQLLQQADAFILPSFGKGEAAPVCVMEAMACGLPVVSTRVGGTPELIQDGQTGLLVPQQDVGALAEALAQILTRPDFAHSLGRAAREHAAQTFDYQRCARQLRQGIRPPLPARPVPVGQRPRILAVVEQCHPQWPSVPLVTFQWVRHLAPHADITLLTHARNKLALEAAGLPVKIVALEESALIRSFYRLVTRILPGNGQNWPLLHSLTYPVYAAFDRQVAQCYQAATAAGQRWDLLWGLSPILPRYPYSLAQANDRPPFVLGPVNGGVPFPTAFAATAKQEFAQFNFLRRLGQWLPGYRATYAASDLVLAGSRHTEAHLRDNLRVPDARLAYCPENGVTDAFFAHPVPQRRPGQALRLLFAGRLTAYKGCDMAIEALARLPESVRAEVKLDIVGEGPQRAELEALAAQHDLSAHITFVGKVAPEAMPHLYAAAHVFCFPSVREFGGAVVMEAMAAGLPCLTVDHGGIGEYVTFETGAKIAPTSRENIIAFLADEITTLRADEPLRATLGTHAREQAHQFGWAHKADAMLTRMLELVHADRNPVRPTAKRPSLAA